MQGLRGPQVLILGCFHEAQDPPTSSCFWSPHREIFAQLLGEIVERHGVRSVGEEARTGSLSSAAILAGARTIPYRNLDIPPYVQNQIRLRPRDGDDPVTGRFTTYEGKDKYRLAWDTVREFHMFETFLELQDGLNPSLLICGTGHQTGLADLLQSRGFEVLHYVFDLDPDGRKMITEPLPEGGFSVRLPDIPEICRFGNTIEEAREMAQDALRCYQESAAQSGER